MNRCLPVTLVGGFFGAGKTSLLHHLISEHRGGHLAVLVENSGGLNPDVRALQGLCGAMRRTHDVVLEIPAGDEAAQTEWIAAQLRDFASAGRYERVLIELGGMTNPARLGRYFGAALQQIVTVVDALDFVRTMLLPARHAGALADFQRAQIEGATLLVLNKCDLVDDSQRVACTRLLRAINPDAKIIETDYGEVPAEVWTQPATAAEVKSVLERRLKLSPSASEAPEAALSSTTYRAFRPFHPQRFWDWFGAEHPGLLRVKGLIWLATRNLLVGGISRTRWQNSCGAAGVWWAALPREEWPEEPEALLRMQETWREPYGDRRQEIVLIGEASSLPAITKQLNGCLLTEEEYKRPTKEWTRLPDPFPEWDLENES